MTERPTVVCLCGSTSFYAHFKRASYEETMAGRIVLSVGFHPHDKKHREDAGCTPEQKAMLDELHKRKIDLADEILVINVGGYIGTSTRSEIEYAASLGKKIRWLDPCEKCDGIGTVGHWYGPDDCETITCPKCKGTKQEPYGTFKRICEPQGKCTDDNAMNCQGA